MYEIKISPFFNDLFSYLSSVPALHMSREFYVLMVAMLAILAWHMSIHVVKSRHGDIIFARTSTDAQNQFARQHHIPNTHVVTYQHLGTHREPAQSALLHGRWSVGARPVVGDHIHMAISFWIHGQPREHAEHDRTPIEDIAYEQSFGKDPQLCLDNRDTAYQKVWPHAGVHTHCDGLIHVHPWSAPRTLRREGLDVQLGLWFDQVGIAYHEYPSVSLQFPDGQRFDSNTTHRWHVAEKTCFKKEKYTLYTDHLDSIWLGHAYASYVVWFDIIGSNPPTDISSHIERLRAVSVHGAFGQSYPQSCH